MIKLTKESYSIALTEFKKGKTFWLAKYSRKVDKGEQIEHDAIIYIKWMRAYIKNKPMMEYEEYDIEGKPISRSYETEWEGWNWTQYTFYVLTKEETEPYYKKILVEQLTNNKLIN